MNVAWVVPDCNRRIGGRERRQLMPHVRFQVPFLGPETQLKSDFACAGLLCSTLNACCLTKRSCHFLFVARVGLAVDFAILRSHFGTARRSQNGTVKVLFFCSFTKQCMRSKWDRQAVPKWLGGPFWDCV